MRETPEISIVIPVYNEAALLRAAVVDLRERLAPFGWHYEIVLAENGSTDGTVARAEELLHEYPELVVISTGEPNYGKALKAGILAARGAFVLCDEIDLCDADFHARAIDILRPGTVDLVIGSKLIAGTEDERPMFRHAASLVYTGILRALLGFRGTDTHGLKGFRRSRMLPIVQACLIEHDVFASEMVIRAYREEFSVTEIPIRVMEKRRPSINLWKRVPSALGGIAKLTWAIGIRG